VPQRRTNPDGTSRAVPLLERLQGVFPPRASDEEFDLQPRRRGMAISMSILVSSLLWFTFTMRETHTKIFEMRTVVVNMAEDEALQQLPPETVRVQVTGDGWSLMRLNLRTPTIPVNAAQSEIQVSDAIPDLPMNLQVLSVSPPVFNLWKELRLTRTVPVRLEAEIETPITHDLIEPAEIVPDSVEVTGASTIVRALEYWPTAQRSFRDVRDTLEVRVPLSDTLGGLVATNVEAVTVRAISKEFTEGMREIEVQVQGQPSTQTLVSLEPSTIRVKYRVMLSQYLEAQNAMDFYATVSYDEIRQDTTGQIEPDLSLPSEIVLRDVEIMPRRLGYYERIE
jgi:YbbR domain-containing protein